MPEISWYSVRITVSIGQDKDGNVYEIQQALSGNDTVYFAFSQGKYMGCYSTLQEAAEHLKDTLLGTVFDPQEAKEVLGKYPYNIRPPMNG